MSNINFPKNPAVNDTYTFGTKTWRFNGIGWVSDANSDDYNVLKNKPQINSIELSGNKTISDLGLQPSGNYATVEELNAKVDKEVGKGLSTNDYTTDEKNKLASIVIGMPETVPTAIAVGGIAAGTNLQGKTALEILDTMLYPELWPTLTDPSSTFTISPNYTYQEVGANITITAAHTFNRGSISPAYGTSGFRSGELINYTETGTLGAYTVILGIQSWTSKANYAAGEQPLGSKGTPYKSPLVAGSTPVITRSIIGVYPVYATTVTITSLTKQALQAHGSDIIVNLVSEDGTHKQTVQIPQAWGTISILQQYNTLSGNWDNIDLTTFTKTSITINGVDYWQYVYNGSTIGSRQLKFKL